MIRKTVTPWMHEGELFTTPSNKFGFVYLITCKHPSCNKKYLGLKFLYRNWGKKTKQADSDWRTYKSSSKYVKEAIGQYGIENFTFEIVQLFDTRAGVVSGEVEILWAAQALSAVDDNGERLYFNQAIGNIKFVTKEHLSQETRNKIGAWHANKPKPYNVGREPPNKGTVSVSKETSEKMALAKLGKPASNKLLANSNPQIECSICGKLVRKSEITRWHKHD